MQDGTDKFWQDFEAETGEKVEVKSMGQVFRPGESRGEWGLIFLTDKALRYRYMPSQSGIMSLFGMQNSSPQRSDKDIDTIIPYATITSFACPPRRWKDRIFGSPFRPFTVAWIQADGVEKQLTFTVDPTNKLAETLEKRLNLK